MAANERVVVTAQNNGVWRVEFDGGRSGGSFKSCKAALAYAGDLVDQHPGAGIRLQPGG
ncbi:hypothetical protein [Roseiterribacter gracilis]|uniref:hypothetical protein n=1 Tax=Roseiterribacter gracilis TaxID=2812848 RepID=UPI003B42C33E